MASLRFKQYAVLASSTVAFTICFMIWMMFAVLGIPIKQHLGLNETEFGILAATPVLSGSLVRVPLGIWTDRFGGRIVLFLLMLICVPFIFIMQYATAYWQFLAIGLLVGLAGGAFSVGTPYVARWFKPEQQGMAMGVFGAGNAGSSLTKLVAPGIIAIGGWQLVPSVYAGIMLVTAILFWLFSYQDAAHLVSSKASLRSAGLMKNPAVLRYCQYYSVVFGGYVALALWMTKYYVGEYGFDIKHAAFLAACFSLPGGVLRAMGGWLSDRFGPYKVTWGVMWTCWVAFFILSYPQTDFSITTTHGVQSFHIGLVLFPSP
jgi:NNP family nitrate/nitrite transporter-like MFS transporter